MLFCRICKAFVGLVPLSFLAVGCCLVPLSRSVFLVYIHREVYFAWCVVSLVSGYFFLWFVALLSVLKVYSLLCVSRVMFSHLSLVDLVLTRALFGFLSVSHPIQRLDRKESNDFYMGSIDAGGNTQVCVCWCSTFV